MTKTSERSLRPWLSEAGGRCPEGTPARATGGAVASTNPGAKRPSFFVK